jgi:hypothetical protein
MTTVATKTSNKQFTFAAKEIKWLKTKNCLDIRNPLAMGLPMPGLMHPEAWAILLDCRASAES